MHPFLILIFGLSFSLSGLFKSESEKELQKLHSTAEKAIERTDYAKAKEAYEEILTRISPPESLGNKYKADWPDFIEAHLRLSEVYLALNENEKGKKLLETLLRTHPPCAFIPKIKLLQARFLATSVSPGESYLLMKEVKESLPDESWTGKELSFFHGVEFSLNEHYDGLCKKAKCFFAASFYQEAATLYEEVEKAIEKGYFPRAKDPLLIKRVRFHLAECYFALSQFDKTVNLIHTIDPLDPATLYLAAKAFSERKEYEKAVECYQKYIDAKDPSSLEHYEEALLELGLYFLRKGEYEKAKSFLEPITDKKGRIGLLSNFHLAKIYLKEGRADLASQLIPSLEKQLKKEDPLRLELTFLKGKCLLAKEDFQQATTLFTVLASTHTPWKEEIQYHLSLSLFNWAKKNENCDKKMLFEKAEQILLSLISSHVKEPYLLTLGELYLEKHKASMNLPKEEMEELFKDRDAFLSTNGKIHSLLFRAAVNPNCYAKRSLLREATNERFQSTSLYATAWYLYGLNELKALEEDLFQSSHNKESLPYDQSLASSIYALEQAFYLSEIRDSALTIPLCKERAKTDFYRHDPSASLSLLQKVLEQFSLDDKEKEEIFYLQGLIAAKARDPHFIPLAKETFEKTIRLYPEGYYAPHCLYALAILAFDEKNLDLAEEKYLQIADSYPSCSLTSRALYWAAMCEADKTKREALLRRCFTDYREHPLADEAYLRLFSLDEYLAGKEEAMDHLKHFEELFPSSRFLVATHFILGSREEKWHLAKEDFQKALAAANLVSEEQREPSLCLFSLRAEIELARLLCEHESESHLAIDHLCHAEKMLQSFPEPTLFEACEFYLAKCYLDINEEKKAEEHFLCLLRHFSDRDIKEGYFLARLWSEQGKIALHKKDTKGALYSFHLAEECGQSFLSEEEKLELLLLQSEAYLQQNRFDLAMRMLSKVINEDVASNLRLKAMYRRAEVYEKEGRFLLAYRQLDALAKKSGEWSQKAKDKLKAEYGME